MAQPADIFDQLAQRVRGVVAEEHVTNLSGVERFTVVHVSPFTLEHVDDDLLLEDGDPDFTIGLLLSQQLTAGGVNVNDEVWVLREGQEWHAIDLVGVAPVAPSSGGGGGGTGRFEQIIPSPVSSITIAHGLGHWPSAVSFYDTSGNLVDVGVLVLDANTIEVTMVTALAGRVEICAAVSSGFEQIVTTPATDIVVTHNLGRWPAAVSFYDTSGNLIQTGVRVVDINTVELTMVTAMAGRVEVQ